MTKTHPTLGPTLPTCYNLFSKGKLSSRDSPLVPILGNPQFILCLWKGSFDTLIKRGLYQASHLVRAGCWPTFQELTDRNGSYQLDFWRMVQLRHFLHTMCPPESLDRSSLPFEKYCMEKGPLLHTLSKMYALLVKPWENFRLPFLRKWELDLSRTFSEGQSTNIIHSTFKTATCMKMQETNFKILSQWYRTPAVLPRCFTNISHGCWFKRNRGYYYIFFGPVLELGIFGKRSERPCKMY